MKILFVIKKSSLLKSGEAPIVVRVTINGVSDEVRIQRSVLPRMWNQARGCCKGRDRVSIELNDYIESLKTKIHNLHKELLLEDALITPSHLLKRLFNKGDKRTFLSTMEKEIKARGAYYVPMEISYEQRMKVTQLIADRILATFAPAVMFTLHDTFGFGKDRLLRWKDAFMKRCDMMSTFDPLGVPYEKVMDYATILTEKYGLEFEWDKIEDVEQDNKQSRKQLCDIEV